MQVTDIIRRAGYSMIDPNPVQGDASKLKIMKTDYYHKINRFSHWISVLILNIYGCMSYWLMIVKVFKQKGTTGAYQ